MAALNKALNILIFIMAIVAAVFSYLLNEKSKELKGNNDNLIAAAQSVSGKIDEAGQTQTGKITAEEQSLAKLKSQVDTLIAQRDYLAQTIVDMEKAVNMTEPAPVKGLTNLSDESYKELGNTAVDYNKSIIDRHTTVVNSIQAWGSSIGAVVNTANLKTIDGYKPTLEEMGKRVNEVKVKADKIVAGVKQAFSKLDKVTLDADIDALNDLADLDSTVETLTGDIEKINAEMAKVNEVKDELTQTQEKLAETEQTVKDKQAIIVKNSEEIVKKDEQILTLSEELKKYEVDPDQVDLNENAVFTVNDVNNEWNIVTFELGEEKMRINVGLIVARGNKYIGSLNVTKVNEENGMAVCEVKSTLAKDAIQIGDQIFIQK